MPTPDYLEEYRPNVGVILFNKLGQVWLGQRAGIISDGANTEDMYVWQMPQGGIDPGEDIIAAAERELYEETGVTTVVTLAVTTGWLVYDFPEGYRSKKKKRWRGQRQKWVAMKFLGQDNEINLDAHEEREFENWRWGSLQETPELIVPFKRDVYEELVEAFTPLAEFLSQAATA